MASNNIAEFEYRGVDNLVFAEVTEDSAENYTTGAVQTLAPVATIAKATDSSSEAHYYDNRPLIVVNSEGADELTLTVAVPDIETMATLLGKYYDRALGAMIDGERTMKYFAIGYRTKGTDGGYRYVWRYKGSFAIPEETNETENEGTDTTNIELSYTGISTVHKFTKGGAAKGMVVDARKDLADVSTFFDTVVTPDSLTAKGA